MGFWSTNPVVESGKYKVYDTGYGDIYEEWVEVGEPALEGCLYYGPIREVRKPQVYREVATDQLWVKEGDGLRSTLNPDIVVYGDLQGFEKM